MVQPMSNMQRSPPNGLHDYLMPVHMQGYSMEQHGLHVGSGVHHAVPTIATL